MARGLVLGGGGITGIAWEIGMLHGLAEAGVHLGEADTVLGTSAGSVVGAQLCSGTDTAALYERQLADATGELAASLPKLTMLRFGLAMARTRSAAGFRRAVGRLALRTTTVPEAERRAVIAGRLPSPEWPATDLRITAVRADTGELRVFDHSGDVPLVDAVAASCAVPGVWPAVTIGDARYVDGGVRSVANVDLAAGCDPVVVLAPQTAGIGRLPSPAAQVRELAATGTRVLLVAPDEAARAAFGPNVLDPARRADSARAGYAQAGTVLDDVRKIWN